MNNVSWWFPMNKVPTGFSLQIFHFLSWKKIFSKTIRSTLRRRFASLWDICWYILLITFSQWGELSFTCFAESQNFVLLHIFFKYLHVTPFTFALQSTMFLPHNFQEFMRNFNISWGLLMKAVLQRCTWKNNRSENV